MIPNVTNLPSFECDKPCIITFLKIFSFLMSWSEESISRVGSSYISRDFNAAKEIADLVFKETGIDPDYGFDEEE